MGETVTFKCLSCGKTDIKPKYCPYTGIIHGRGWTYVCDCRGDMIIEDPTEVDGPVTIKGRDILFPRDMFHERMNEKYESDILDDLRAAVLDASQRGEGITPWRVWKTAEE